MSVYEELYVKLKKEYDELLKKLEKYENILKPGKDFESKIL